MIAFYLSSLKWSFLFFYYSDIATICYIVAIIEELIRSRRDQLDVFVVIFSLVVSLSMMAYCMRNLTFSYLICLVYSLVRTKTYFRYLKDYFRFNFLFLFFYFNLDNVLFCWLINRLLMFYLFLCFCYFTCLRIFPFILFIFLIISFIIFSLILVCCGFLFF